MHCLAFPRLADTLNDAEGSTLNIAHANDTPKPTKRGLVQMIDSVATIDWWIPSVRCVRHDVCAVVVTLSSQARSLCCLGGIPARLARHFSD
jgi:hypothetical protein